MWDLLNIFVAFGFILFQSCHVVGSPTTRMNRIPSKPFRFYSQNTPRIRSNSFRTSVDPWLHPKDGILASGKTKVLLIRKDKDAKLVYHELNNAVNHIVIHSKQLASAQIDNYIRSNRRQRRNRYSRGQYLRDRKMLPRRPNIVYPELAIAVSYDYFQKFNFDYWVIIPYLLSFWNAVDMRYRGLENPKYRFHVSQFIFESEPGNFEFLKNHGNPDYLTYDCIRNARRFWYEQNKSIALDSYDIMLVMTSSIICSTYDEETNNCNPRIFGQAWPSGACSVDHANRKIDKVAIIHDNGAYEGITTAAHEIGHLLGANDDGVSLYNHITNTYGPQQCDTWAGYIMAGNKQASRNSFEWSKCSLREFEKFINSEKARCLYNRPNNIGRSISRYLPGKLMSADEQCVRAGAIESCEGGVSNCVMLQCRFENEGCTNMSAPAVEGTCCSSSRIAHICIHGECVSEYDLV